MIEQASLSFEKFLSSSEGRRLTLKIGSGPLLVLLCDPDLSCDLCLLADTLLEIPGVQFLL
ncbi:hypothetical protein OJF2_41510 [Aquisphaera giovannonii]|uniref:Uncharacterized protein n=1 Tax=Aquisphaera giovannonii TaxID=406548 RepID=A0A5B9W4Y1_9BACT|nr:hypothetical protein OJF2_41510 [Aquisphaera giovannonii]